jgi:protein tyrosine phosphatase
VAFNPFFDAIRQNLELSQGVTERIPLRFPQSVMDRVEDLPFRWLRELVRHARAEGVVSGPKDQMDEGSETLAMQFYRIELAEQRRLTGIMQHHSTQDSGVRVADADNAVAFPYSITAGVEKGGKNRYRNIWPFEHARVRLQQTRSSDDDYINASYVQPLGTKKRYIATQGPLPATFGDFWAYVPCSTLQAVVADVSAHSLVWEQNVHVVVMLTREIEGAMVKCGKYWAEGTYGALRLRQLSSSGGTPDTSSDVRKPDAGAAGFFMPSVPAATAHASPSMICRTFELSHTGFPKARPRKITQFHYVDWPDMNVPESPRGLLDLIREVNHARTQAEVTTAAERARAASSWDWKGVNQDQACTITGVARHALGHQPVLLHCSAGVGRTGGFIAVDAILDGIRHELAADDVQYAEIVVDSSDCEERELQAMAVDTSSSMDVDMPSTSTTPIPVIMTGQIGQHHEARAAVQRSSPAGSLRKPRRPSREGIWAKNDPRQMPLRKWLVATNEATTRDAQLAPAVSPVPTLTGAPLNASPGPMKSANALPPSTTPSPSLASLNVSFSPGPVFPQEDPLHKTLPPLSAARLHSDSQRVRAASAPSVASGILARRLAAQNTSGLGGPHESTSSLSTPSDAGPSLFSAIGGSATSVTSPSPTSSILLVPTVSACPPSSEGPTETFDYTTPRKLHTDAAPCPLSTLSEPIRAVIEDAREQRMSLCQSLRQYVFVHQAVVEGALALVDELHAAPTRARTTSGASTASGSTAESVATASVLRPSMSPSRAKRRRSTMDADGLREAGATLSKRPSIKRERIAGDSCA